MTNLARFLVPALAVLASASVAGQQTPSTPATGVIVGQLVDGGSGKPVSSAVVSLSPPPVARPVGPDGLPPPFDPAAQAQPLRALTDGNGRFMFYALAPGSYSMTASRAGYVTASFGQTQPQGGSRGLSITDAQRVNTVAMKIWKYASITGRVVDETGEPAVGVNLRLLRRSGGVAAPRYSFGSIETTDDRGIYRFGSVLPGDYLISIATSVSAMPLTTVEAYLESMAGAAGPASMMDNSVRAGISASGGSLITSGMRVGDQIISGTMGRGGGPPPVVGPGARLSVYPTTFYPGGTSVEGATVITLASGDERSGADMAIKLVAATHVSGMVTGPGGPAANITVKIVAPGLEALGAGGPYGFEAATAVTRADGTFTAIGVPVGQYVVTVLKVPAPPMTVTETTSITTSSGGSGSFSATSSSSAGPPAEPVLWARVPVSVPAAGVDGVAVPLSPGRSVSGRIEFETGTAPIPAADVLQRGRVTLSSVEPSTGRFTPAIVAADGSFTTQGHPPGRYLLSMSLPAAGWTMKSVTMGGRNVLSSPFDLSTSDLSVIVTFTDKSSEISGSVVRGTASDTDRVLVVLLPVDYQALVRDGLVSRSVKSTVASQTGSFRLTGILAGEYLIVATAATPDLQDQQAIVALARQATRITIGDKEKRSMSLTVVSGRRP